MKHPVLFLLFYIAASVLTAMRVIQQLFFVDQTTGFFQPRFETAGYLITYLCFALLVIIAVYVLLAVKVVVGLPTHSVGFCVVLVIVSALMLIAGLLETFDVNSVVGMLGIVSAVAMAWYAFSVGVNGPFPPLIMIALPVYALLKLLIRFMDYRGEISYTFSMFNMLTLTAIVVFSLCFAKLINGIQSKNGIKLFYISAFVCCFLSLSQGLIPLMGKLFAVDLHGVPSIEMSYFAYALLSIAAVSAVDLKRS